VPGWNIQTANIAGPHNGADFSETDVQTKKRKQHRNQVATEGDSRSVAGMTKEPSDAETCLHVSISEANKSGHEVE